MNVKEVLYSILIDDWDLDKMSFDDSGAAAPGFNSLIPAPSVPSLISTEPVELFCRASNISSTDPFCFVKQKIGSG